MLIPNCRENETYNEDFLNDKDKIRGRINDNRRKSARTP